MSEILKYSRAFKVDFKKLERWDVAFFREVNWKWPESQIDTIGSCLFRSKISMKCLPEDAPIIEKITFGGILSLLPKEKRKGYKGKLYRAEAGQLIYSKIRVKQGSVCVIPESYEWVAVSSEYPVYSLDRTKIGTKYLELVLRSSAFKIYIDGLSHGGSTKTRIAPEEFEALRIPIPPLSIQESIVKHWKTANNRLEKCKTCSNKCIKLLDSILKKSTNYYFELINSHFFIAYFSKTQQWDVKSGRSAVFRAKNPSFVRLGSFIEECTEIVKPWEEPEKDWPVYGVDNEKGVFFNSYQKGKAFNVAYKRIKENWFFHNPTRANVGSLGIVPNVTSDSITSPEYQVWRLKDGFLPEFMALLLKTNYFLTLVEFNRVGGVKQRMYYANLAEIRLPMLDIDVQIQFANEWMNAQIELQKAEINLKETQKEIEEMILGFRHVE